MGIWNDVEPIAGLSGYSASVQSVGGVVLALAVDVGGGKARLAFSPAQADALADALRTAAAKAREGGEAPAMMTRGGINDNCGGR